ncbi:TPA: phage tail protein, partial [Proteus mirabilis]
MSAKFFALLTVIGANKLAKATALGTTLKITQMAVGDGGGTLPMPSEEQTKLVNEKRRAGINTLFIDSKNANQIVAEQVIPENEGGYWIREIGLFDDEGSLIAVGNCPETYKPQLQEGSGRTQTIRMILTVSHTESVELKVDPSVILATRESVDNAIEIASKSILDTVEKEYATKDEVKKKFDNSNIVHEKGVSKEKVISQKGVTELFQPKGNYQPAGNYVTTATFNLEINKKIDKSSLSQQLGNDVNKVPSLDLVTKELGNKQPKGDYALKTWVDNIYYKRDDSPSFNEISATAIRVNSVNVALKGDCYTKSESDNKYSPKLPFVYSSGEESKIISPNNKILIFVNDNGTTGGYD